MAYDLTPNDRVLIPYTAFVMANGSLFERNSACYGGAIFVHSYFSENPINGTNSTGFEVWFNPLTFIGNVANDPTRCSYRTDRTPLPAPALGGGGGAVFWDTARPPISAIRTWLMEPGAPNRALADGYGASVATSGALLSVRLNGTEPTRYVTYPGQDVDVSVTVTDGFGQITTSLDGFSLFVQSSCFSVSAVCSCLV